MDVPGIVIFLFLVAAFPGTILTLVSIADGIPYDPLAWAWLRGFLGGIEDSEDTDA